ncbi:MAG: hypothetical protein ACI33S_02790 [Bacilli bacterium]
MNELPNTSIYLDSPRINQINDFLNMMLSVAKENNTTLTADDVYYLLCRFNIKNNDHNKRHMIENLFYSWIDKFKGRNNINVFRADNWRYFCQFTNKAHLVQGKDIKMYIPIDYDHLDKGVSELFNFMSSLNMTHASKVGLDLRNDNVVVRLPINDVENAYKIIEFCNNNKYIKSGLNQTNPFVPNYNNIGLMYEEGFSYNYEMAKGIATFINRNKHRNRVTIDDFNREFDYLFSNNEYYDSIKAAYNEATGLSKGQFQKNGKAVSMNTKELNYSQKKEIFLKTVSATYNKYGPEQVKFAILRAIKNNDYGYFTSANQNLRNKLKNNVNSQEMHNIIFDIVTNKFGIVNGISLDDLINRFISLSFENALVNNLNNICIATLQKYGVEQLRTALYSFYHFGITNRFTRRSNNPNDLTNYRDMLSSYNKVTFIDTIKNYLSFSGINIENMKEDELMNYYADYLYSNMRLKMGDNMSRN